MASSHEPSFAKMTKEQTRQRIAWLLLGIAFLVGCLTVYSGLFSDEADSLVVGQLLARGYVLYRDIFSHHFPFPYYWTAAVVSLFGKSIFVVRLSLWLFQVAAIGIAMALSRFELPLALVCLVWSVIRHLYMGNLVLYPPFASVSLLVVFAITISILLDRVEANWKQSAAIGIFSAIAFASDPLSAYAIVIALVFVLFKAPRSALIACIVAGLLLAAYGAYLLASGTLDDFWENAILFNSRVYAKYAYSDPIRFDQLWLKVRTGLEITDQAWWDLDPFRQVSFEFRHFDSWAYSGLLYRLAILVGVGYLATQKRFAAAGFVYLFAAATLSVARWGFRATGFVMVSLVVLFAIVLQLRRGPPKSRQWGIARGLISGVLGLMVIWLGLRVAHHTVTRGILSRQLFSQYEYAAMWIQDLACGRQEDTLLGHYPDGIYHYWFTGMKPVSKYVYLWPWVADVGLADIIEDLDRPGTLALVFLTDTVVWDTYVSREYLGALYAYLRESYEELEPGVYRSPALEDQCHK